VKTKLAGPWFVQRQVLLMLFVLVGHLAGCPSFVSTELCYRNPTERDNSCVHRKWQAANKLNTAEIGLIMYQPLSFSEGTLET
jgi:hypothetical protein